MSNLAVVYLASPKAAGWMDWTRLDCLVASLKLLRLHAPAWPVIVFHEDYEEAEMERLKAVAENITFEKVDFSGQEHLHVNRRPDNRVGTYGYCMMCRFFSGQMQNHPAIQPYTHYMRLDDDSYIMEPLTPDCVERILSSDYTFRSLYQESHREIYDYTVDFMNKEGLPKTNRECTSDSPYNNFHVSSLAMWRHPVVRKFLNGIEDMYPFAKFGWTDTNVHSMLIWLLGPALGFKVNIERFAYRHNLHCIHDGPHGQYCSDHLGGQYNWGPPACLEQK